jgi:hypothetical protein
LPRRSGSYKFEKRQKELSKKQKQAKKRERRMRKKGGEDDFDEEPMPSSEILVGTDLAPRDDSSDSSESE